MKTLITLISTAVLTFLSSMILANTKAEPIKFLKAESIIDHYIDATTNGETSLLKYLFTEDFKFSSPNNSNKEQVTRSTYIKHLKGTKGLKLDVTTSYTFVEKNNDCSIVRVESKFEKFSKYEYVTLCNTNEGWKIRNIVATYPEK